MPTICSFFGIVIRMYHDDHGVPHFHAYYGGDEASISIERLALLEGRLPRRAMSMVLEWAHVHRDELMENWQRAAAHETLNPIEPLD